jgi:hypothetical protein
MRSSYFQMQLKRTTILLFIVLLSGVFYGCSEKNEYVEPQ